MLLPARLSGRRREIEDFYRAVAESTTCDPAKTTQGQGTDMPPT